MFNVRALANKYIQVTNPNQKINWVQSNGYVTDDAGKRTPKTITLTVDAQVQALSATDLKHIDGLNITGVMRSVYMYGNAAGVVRADQIGGDILVFPEVPGGCNKNWLINQVIETWSDWCHVIVTLQVE
jgi:hypothetical protein